VSAWAKQSAASLIERRTAPALVGLLAIALTLGVAAAAADVETPRRFSRPAATYSGTTPDQGEDAARDSLVASLENLPVGRITVRPLDIYDPIPAGPVGAVFRLANRLHVRTRSSTIRNLLPFRVGDLWRDALGREASRSLRSLDFLYPQRLEARSLGDSVEVLVETRDVWSTRLEFNLESFEGQSFGSVALNELNFLGFGKSIWLSYREEPAGAFRSFSFQDPSLFGSRLRLRTTSSTGTTGSSDRYSIALPFYAEDAPYSYGVSWTREGSVPHLYQRGSVVAELDKHLREGELFWGMAARHEDMIQRLLLSIFIQDRELGPMRVTPQAVPGFQRPGDDLQTRRISVEGRLWRPRFIERSYVNRLGFVEDYDIGSSFRLKLGYSPKAFGGTAGEAYTQMQLFAGASAGSGFGWLRSSVSGRIRREPREVLARVDARWMQQIRDRHAAVFSAVGVSGSRMPPDFQVGVGGLTGLRSYQVQAVSGRRLWRFNAEGRWTVAQNYFDALTIGIVGFTDAARAWGTGSEGSTWHYSAGTGLRFALPLWSASRVLRIDVAWPVSPTRDGKRDPVFSFGSGQAF